MTSRHGPDRAVCVGVSNILGQGVAVGRGGCRCIQPGGCEPVNRCGFTEMSTILPQKLYRFVLHKLQLLERKIDLIENQHHFSKSLIFICGLLVRCCKGNDLLWHAVVRQREILCSKTGKRLALALCRSDVEVDYALPRCVRLHFDRLRRNRGLYWNLRGFKLTISTGQMDHGQKAK